MKKILALLFSLILCFGLSCVNVSAEGFGENLSGFSSKALFMIEKDTTNVLYSSNADEKMHAPFLAKLMTFIVASEVFEDPKSTMITYTETAKEILQDTGLPTAVLSPGDTFSLYDYFNMILIPSGHDANVQVALYYDSEHGVMNNGVGRDLDGVDYRAYKMSNSLFVEKMNETAKKIGCENTNFVNVTDLYHEEQYTTAKDCALIINYAMNLEYYDEIINRTIYYTPETDTVPNSRSLYNTNPMYSSYLFDGAYYYSYTTGGKNSSSNISGHSMFASASQNNYDYIVVTLGAPMYDEFDVYLKQNGAVKDAKDLFRWAYSNVSRKTVVREGYLISEVPVKYSYGTESLQLFSGTNVTALLPNSVGASDYEFEITKPDYIEAPVGVGQIVGSADIIYAGNTVATVALVTRQSAGRSEFLAIIDFFVKTVTNPITLIVFIAFVIALVVTIKIIKNRVRLKRKRKQKELLRAKRESEQETHLEKVIQNNEVNSKMKRTVITLDLKKDDNNAVDNKNKRINRKNKKDK